MNMNMNSNMNQTGSGREPYLRKPEALSRLRTREKMTRMNAMPLGTRRYSGRLTPGVDRKNPEFD